MNKNKVTLYHEASSGGFKQWSIWIEKDHTTVSVEWGKVGCTLQTSSDTTKPKGKLGTAAFMDERACAQFNYERQLRKKREEGYRDTMDDADDQDLFAGLTKRFVPAKPRNDVDEETLFKLDYDRKLWVQRKRDGQRHLVLITKTGKVKIYSRRMDDMTKHFPKLCASIEYLGLPKRTILDGEIIVDRDGADDFRAVGTVTRSKAEKAAGREKDLPIRFMAFDLLYYAGAETWKASYEQRYTTLAALLAVSVPSVFVPKILGTGQTLGRIMERAKAEGWEGIVCWLKDDPTLVRDGGKPKRCGCIKWKPKKEQDFIATGYYLGSGEMSQVVGGLNIAEIDPTPTVSSAIILRDCGNAGCFKGDSIVRTEALTWDYPCVVSIEFDRQEPEGKLRFPVILKKHEDKLPEECVGLELGDNDE